MPNFKYSIEDLKSHAHSLKGECLSDSYSGIMKKYKWKCECGNVWNATWSQVKGSKANKPTWCKKCSHIITSKAKALSINDCIKHAKLKNGKCLSREYKNAMTPIKWECEFAHTWSARFGHIRQGHWCPECANEIRSSKLAHNEKDVRAKIKSLYGKPNFSKYINCKQKLNIECMNGHLFNISYSDILRGRWCKKCSKQNIGEEYLRFIFEQLTNKKFPTVRSEIPWLVYKRNHLELDGYNKTLNIAFEHHGEQHFKFISKFHKTEEDFLNQKKRDIAKARLCKRNGVPLYITRQIENVEQAKLEVEKIRFWLIERGIKIRKKVNFDEFHLYFYTKELKRLQKIVNKKGGLLLTKTYLGCNAKYSVNCSKGHTFPITGDKIVQGGWCPKCAGRNRDIKFFHDFAKLKKGRCLSKKYINAKTKLIWQCEFKHKPWEATPDNVVTGKTWCPTCKKEKIRKKKILSDGFFEDLREYHGVKLLDEYINAKEKYVWKCKSNHRFKMTQSNLKTRIRRNYIACPECAKSKGCK